jgi:hypothetical protein
MSDAVMFEYTQDAAIDVDVLAGLFQRVGWSDADSSCKLEWAMAASERWITCEVEGELIGFGRLYKVDSLVKLVFDVVVDERFQDFGVDAEIVRMLAAGEVTGMHELQVFRTPVVGAAGVEGYDVPEAPPGTYLG